jgi:LysR family transcriptional regulator for bpeEF and oprC
MDRIDVMRLFARVAETGNFSKAAAAFGIGQPAASKQIAALETRLGAQLLRRTSRGLSLTAAGQDYYEAAVNLASEFDAAEARVGRGQSSPSGLLRVAISPGFGRMYVVPQLPRFLSQYPDLAIEFDISERYVDLVEEGVDIAIRIGRLADSTLLARRIGDMEVVTAASASYLDAHGEPATPADLDRHAAVAFIARGAPMLWQFEGPKGPVAITPTARGRPHDAEHIRAAVLAGLGVTHSAGWLFAADFASGSVRRVLVDFAPPPSPIHAVYSARRLVPGKVKVFVDFLEGICADNPFLARAS